MDPDGNARNNFLSGSLSVKLSHFFSYAKFVLAKHFVFSAFILQSVCKYDENLVNKTKY